MAVGDERVRDEPVSTLSVTAPRDLVPMNDATQPPP
jgi:hypothetical protein